MRRQFPPRNRSLIALDRSRNGANETRAVSASAYGDTITRRSEF
jgi:hypothetical protein